MFILARQSKTDAKKCDRTTIGAILWLDDGKTRHVQLKSSYRGARRADVTASVNCSRALPPCILWIFFDPDTLSLGPFLWFGSAPGERMPLLGEIARHTKPNAVLKKADRPAHRVIPKSRFATLETIDQVIQKMVGV
jgi:hypothetical protein